MITILSVSGSESDNLYLLKLDSTKLVQVMDTQGSKHPQEKESSLRANCVKMHPKHSNTER